MRFLFSFFVLILFLSAKPVKPVDAAQMIVILGVAQDAGYPQAGCNAACCKAFVQGKVSKKRVSSLALIDKASNQYWLFDASPDITSQLQDVHALMPPNASVLPAAVFLTHAHIGHYTGLMYFGREAMGTQQLPVYTMPKMQAYLQSNGPWSQLVQLQNIVLQPLQKEQAIRLNNGLMVTPLQVPHRDEFSETVGFVIASNTKKLLYIPDIDKWNKWDKNIITEIAKVDYAVIDGTFYKNGELKNRDMQEVPHPFIEETIQLLEKLPIQEKKKVIFIHFNHTNPLLQDAKSIKALEQKGFSVAKEGMKLSMN